MQGRDVVGLKSAERDNDTPGMVRSSGTAAGTEDVTNQVFIMVRKQANTSKSQESVSNDSSRFIYLPAIQATKPPSGGGVLVDPTGSGSPLLKAKLGTGIRSELPSVARSCWGSGDCLFFSSSPFVSMLPGALPS